MDKKVEKKINIKVIIIALVIIAVASVGSYFMYSKNKVHSDS